MLQKFKAQPAFRDSLLEGVVGLGRTFLLLPVNPTGGSAAVGVGLAPPLGFQFATLQISSMPNLLGFPSLSVSPYSLACFLSHISKAFLGVFPFNASREAVTSFQAHTAAASFRGEEFARNVRQDGRSP